jgi:hypothetical protein
MFISKITGLELIIAFGHFLAQKHAIQHCTDVKCLQ